jgi:REP element-mobilizing transposase RayT
MSEPLAYLISWTTYGTWLPGDTRGWVKKGTPGIQAADEERLQNARQQLEETPIVLNATQRNLVEDTIKAHCEIRGWRLHAVNARTNHVHAVITAPLRPEVVMDQLKAWCSRRLNELAKASRKRWWTRHGSTKWINDEGYLENAVHYVRDGQ